MPMMPSLQPQSLYPRNDTLSETISQLSRELPIATHNELLAALALYHNTLLYVQYQHQMTVGEANHEQQ